MSAEEGRSKSRGEKRAEAEESRVEERRQMPEDSLRHVSATCSLWPVGAPPRIIHPHSTSRYSTLHRVPTRLGILPAWNKISRHVHTLQVPLCIIGAPVFVHSPVIFILDQIR